MNKGRVIIAGAGPGDPELITLKTARYLQQADVILVDRLVSPEILSRYANPAADIISVGKEGRATASVSQKSINELLVAYYQRDKLIVRLKGGDVAFFSNILDELQTLQQYGIPYVIIPGITAASGASAYSGIPLTARGYADSVRFLTYFNKEDKPDTYWSELTGTADTLVFYMSGAALPSLAAHLARHHLAADKMIAVVEQATTPYQQVTVHQVQDFVRDRAPVFVSPTLIIIGRVVALYKQFGWVNSRNAKGQYFKSVPEEVAALNQHIN